MFRNDIEALKDEKSAVSKVLRSRFRVPYHVFEMVRECCSLTCSYTDLTYPPCLHYAPVLQIVGWVRNWLEAEKARADATGRADVPVELKVLGVLRVFGRATCFDGIFELSGIGVTTMTTFFHKITEWFSIKIYPEFVFMPRNKDELVSLAAPYALLGVPGAFFSMDVVHCAWAMCPTAFSILATGKEGYPTIAWNVIVGHDGRALAAQEGSWGSFNDKSIVHYSDEVHAVPNRPVLHRVRVRGAHRARGGRPLQGGFRHHRRGVPQVPRATSARSGPWPHRAPRLSCKAAC